jgi:plastocyanin
MISKKIVIPHEFSKSTQPGSSLRFFSPRLIVIQIGQPIEFKNNDDSSHYLESVNLQGKPDSFFTTGEIKSGQSVTVKLKNFRKMLPYRCKIHPAERGVILMTGKDEKDLTDTERLRLLTKTVDSDQEFWNLIKEMDVQIE